MGISGLLPLLKDITTKAHIKEFQGKRAAVDGYVWLYKGSYSCPEELCEGKPTDKFVKYCMSMVDLLLHHGVQPIVVLDGDKMPAKALTEQQRQSSRAANRERGRQLAAAGNRRAAMEMYQRSVEVTPQMARAFMEALAAAGVAFIVAPYEADAQMAYLAKTGVVDIVITEDSDLLVYGCPQVVFKLSRTGECDHIKMQDLPMNRSPSFSGFSHENFIEMCILSGCDFVQSLPGMGIKKAHAGVKRFRTFPNVIKSAKLSNTKIPCGYECAVQRAYWTFRHQRVWCPTRQTMVHLNAIPNGNIADSRMFVPSALPEGGDLSFLGAHKPDDVSCAIAEGRIDPMTHKPFLVTYVDGIVHVAPPDREVNNQHPRMTAPAIIQPTQMHGTLKSQPTEIVSLLQTSHGAGRSDILGHARKCGAIQQRASAPGRVQCASQSRQNAIVQDVVLQHKEGAASNHATGASISGRCVISNQPTAVEKAKGELADAAMTMRGRLLAALTSHNENLDCNQSFCGSQHSKRPPSSPCAKVSQAQCFSVHPPVGISVDEADAKVRTRPQLQNSIPGPPLGEDGGSLYTHVLQGHTPSQSESGADSALSLLTTSSLSQGKGHDLQKVSEYVEASCAQLTANHAQGPSSSTLNASNQTSQNEGVPQADAMGPRTQATLIGHGRSPLTCVQNIGQGYEKVLSPIALNAAVGRHCGPGSSTGRQRGSLKELLQKNTSGSSMSGAIPPGDEDHVKNPPRTKSVADLKRCKYALPKSMPFKKPRRELRRL